jgi:hypothetical protein
MAKENFHIRHRDIWKEYLEVNLNYYPRQNLELGTKFSYDDVSIISQEVGRLV